jgi:hypothetical protein
MQTNPETETPVKESRLKKLAPAVGLGAVFIGPSLIAAGAGLLGLKTAKTNLEVKKLELEILRQQNQTKK